MDEEQWMYDSIMSEEVDMNVENEEDAGGKVEHVDCSYAFNISQVFVYFVVVGTVIILHRCLLMLDLI